MSDLPIHSYGFGLASTNSKQDIIEVFYPAPEVKPESELARVLLDVCGFGQGQNGFLAIDDELQLALVEALSLNKYPELADLVIRLGDSAQQAIICVLSSDEAPSTIPEAYLKLHLLSHRLAKPHSLNIDGIFGVLRTLAWTNQGAIDLDDLPERQLAARLRGEPMEIMSVDKFPKMTSYVVPSGVRIAHSARVRLGAYLGEGTTVMHEGFVNFNAGTVGTAMIEGRISAGVMVGNNSDLGGGCSTMGTLSGGGTEIISIGENCLIGANGGVGFPLADGCIVEAGLYVTAGTKLHFIGDEGELLKTVKAKELIGVKNRLYRRNSLSGVVECVPIKSAVTLNEELHSHN